jgi:hypothetical protein
MADFRASAARLREEGRQLATRIDREVRALAKRTRADFAGDVRKLQTTIRGRADDAIRDIEKRSNRILSTVEKQVAKAGEEMLRRFRGATQGEVAELAKRVRDLEARLAALEGRSEEKASA